MHLLNVFIIVTLIAVVSTINDTIPKIPSRFLPGTQSLPERSANTTTQFPFEEYIPIACFCDWTECNADVQSIESPIIGLLTRDAKMVKSLSVKVNKGELMFIILIDSKSSLANDTYLERTSYWHLIDNQHKLLAGVPLDLEIRREVSVSILNESSSQFSLENETKHAVINALTTSNGLFTLIPEELEKTAHYYYPASEVSQVVGVYQLFYELIIHPGILLINYVKSQKSPARCSLYVVVRGSCGSLQFMPSSLQRTSTFQQAAVNVTLPSDMDTITENDQKSKRKGVSKTEKAFVIFISISIILSALYVAITYYIKNYRPPPEL